jgi:predicted tellurium resistance membrane protein TerC
MVWEVIIALLTLIALETVLGIDNVIFISIIAQRLPQNKQKKAIRWGLIIAMVSRLGLLSLISLILKLKADLFHLFGEGISGKDIILIVGGIFLIYKATTEIRHKMSGEIVKPNTKKSANSFAGIMLQIFVMDMVFSLDSIITAVGLVEHIWIMYIAIVVTVAIMMFAAYPISKFVNAQPTFKMLALSFLLLIGFSLVTEGFGIEIPKGYIYFAMFFSLTVDVLQMKMKKPVDENIGKSA